MRVMASLRRCVVTSIDAVSAHRQQHICPYLDVNVRCMHACGAVRATSTACAASAARTPAEPPQVHAAFPAAPADAKQLLKDLTFEELEKWCVDMGERPARAMHIWRWLYDDGQWIRQFSDTVGLQNGFSRAFAEKAAQVATCSGNVQLQNVVTSEDGTRKLLFAIDGLQREQIETVLIPVVRKQGHKKRTTVCVSSQVGCAMGCTFCYTGKMGLLRNLSTGQIVEQLVEAKRLLAETGDDSTATNIVFMGMGEPFNNYDAVMAAIQIATHPMGLHFSKNKVTVSTVGLVPQIKRFCCSSVPAQLAVSLHATNDTVRNEIVPINKTHTLAHLMAALRDEFPQGATAKWHDRHVMFEYVMLKGVNDHAAHAHELLKLVEGIECKVNLIVFNPHEGTVYEASDDATVKEFRSIVIQGERVCTIRDSRGSAEMAACGQLGNINAALSKKLNREQSMQQV